MLLTRWPRLWTADSVRKQPGCRGRRPGVRPHLQALEDRCLLTSVAVPDFYTMSENTSLSADVTENDINPDGYGAEILTEPSHGDFFWGGGPFIYNPHPDFVGVDTFVYYFPGYVCTPWPFCVPTLTAATATITVLPSDNEPMPTVAINDVAVAEPDSGTANAIFTVTLSKPSNYTVSVSYTTTDGTAKAGADYHGAGGTLIFDPGETSKTIAVPVDSDTTYEIDETFFVNFTGVINAHTADSQGQATILTNPNDKQPTVSIADVSMMEGTMGGYADYSTPFEFTVSLSNPSYQPITVDFTTADGTAKYLADYYVPFYWDKWVTFEAGETTETITVLVEKDSYKEANETFYVNLSNAPNATITDGQAVGTILNDDDDPPSISITDVRLSEGNSGTKAFVFTVTLSAASSQTVSVNYATADGTAKAGSDYQSASGTLSFAPGETSKTITVLVNGDTLKEIDETFAVNLSGAINATLADWQALGTIRNDDKN